VLATISAGLTRYSSAALRSDHVTNPYLPIIEELSMSSRPPVLNAQQVLEGLKALRERQKVGFSAFFSSI
jgi:hypothetical protein